MKKTTLEKIIRFNVLCGLIAFVLGFVDMWAFLAAFIFGCMAMVCGILINDLAFRDFPISTISICDLCLMGIKADNLTEDDMKKICALVHDELKQNNALHNLIVKASNQVIKSKGE